MESVKTMMFVLQCQSLDQLNTTRKIEIRTQRDNKTTNCAVRQHK